MEIRFRFGQEPCLVSALLLIDYKFTTGSLVEVLKFRTEGVNDKLVPV